jgi:large subunit ribosomal protein L9
MQVILLQDVKNVGKKDEIIKANDGYARNYLFPKKLAVEANKENLLKLEAKQKATKNKKEQDIEEAKKLAEKLKAISLDIKVKAGENGKIFGGVTPKEISEELEKQYKISIDKKKINIKETIKTLGGFGIEIKLGDGVLAKLVINVKSE